MLIRYIRTAWRSLWVRRWYTLLNVCGLALAIGCCTLLYTYISYHLSFDDYHPKAGTTYRIVYDLHLEKTEFDKGSSYAMLNTARQQLPQVIAAGFLISDQSYIIGTSTDAKGPFREDKTIAITDADWFKLFKYELAGGSTQLLNEPNTALLTQKQAIKYFGNEQAVGQYITIKNTSIKVVGVLKDAPYNTDLRYDVYLSLRTLPNIDSNFTKDYYTQYGYLSTVNNAYIALQNNKQKAQVEKALNQMVKAQFGDGAKYYTFKLLPLGMQHFDGRYGGKVQRSLLIILTIIGALIIVIASINYINIMIAQQARRSVEIGTRKVLGASGSQLFFQLMFESALTTLLATALAAVLVVVALPLISRYLFVDDSIHVISYLQLGLFMTGVLIFIDLLTGVYPALMLSRATIYDALKNKMLNTNSGVGRKVLVVVQNVIAQVLIACTIVIVMQVKFLKSTDKGFDRKWVITLPIGDASEQQKHLLKQSIAQIQGVSSATICLKQPSSDNQRGGTVLFNGRPDWEKWPARFAFGDEDYLRTFGLRLLAGRIPHKEPSTPEFLINEKMVAMLHVKDAQEVLGRTLNAGDNKGIIVGVVKDFAVRSLLEPIEPAVILQDKSLQTNLAVKLSGHDLGGVLDHLKKLYGGVLPDQVFTYHFIDDEIAALYKAETLQQKLIWSAAIIAIIISSLGLLGIISLITFQRTKEIGIRKVLGASVGQIGMLLSAELVKMVGIALLIAVPLSWWLAHAWLQNFVHHINIQWWMFLLAGSSAMLIALATVGFRALRAAVVNPVNSLRSE